MRVYTRPSALTLFSLSVLLVLASSSLFPIKAYGKTLDFWGMLDVLYARNVEIAHNRIVNAVRNTADAGALEYWGVGANNSAHHNCFSDMDPGVLDGSWMNFLFQVRLSPTHPSVSLAHAPFCLFHPFPSLAHSPFCLFHPFPSPAHSPFCLFRPPPPYLTRSSSTG
jgi:hypothetical protein